MKTPIRSHMNVNPKWVRDINLRDKILLKEGKDLHKEEDILCSWLKEWKTYCCEDTLFHLEEDEYIFMTLNLAIIA